VLGAGVGDDGSGAEGGWRGGGYDLRGSASCGSGRLAFPVVVVPAYPEKGVKTGRSVKGGPEGASKASHPVATCSVVAISPVCLALWARGFALLPESERLLLCLPRKEVTKKKGPLARRPPAAFATSGCVEGGPGFSAGHPALTKRRDILVPARLRRPDRPALTAAKGTRKSKSSQVERGASIGSPRYITSPSPLRRPEGRPRGREGGMRGRCSRERR
jgi:hypothetical protein